MADGEREVKQQVHLKCGIPLHQQRLIFSSSSTSLTSTDLADNTDLSDLNHIQVNAAAISCDVVWMVSLWSLPQDSFHVPCDLSGSSTVVLSLSEVMGSPAERLFIRRQYSFKTANRLAS